MSRTPLSFVTTGRTFSATLNKRVNNCVHYRSIARMVKETAHEFGLPCKGTGTFIGALAGRARLLKQSGVKAQLIPAA